MVTGRDVPGPVDGRVFADPAHERLVTLPNAITVVRTVGALVLAVLAADAESLALLLAALAVYWVGDMADGAAARLLRRETRIGAALDILSDRLCSAAFYVGLVWLDPTLALPVAVYLVEFMVVDAFLSLAFLAWPLSSPNYFYVVDRVLWRWNWSKPGKAVNSAAFALLLVWTRDVVLGTAVATALLALKVWSVARLSRIGLPIPEREPPRR